MVSDKTIGDRGEREGVNIIQFRSISVSFGRMYIYFFYLKGWMLELQKILLPVRFFNRVSCNKGLKAKISHFFFLCFSCSPPSETAMLQNQKDCFVPDVT